MVIYLAVALLGPACFALGYFVAWRSFRVKEKGKGDALAARCYERVSHCRYHSTVSGTR
jgi:hypothetical protein